MPLTLPDMVLHRLKTAQRVVVLTGGGMAAESNIPTFREALSGPWAEYDVRELATEQAFLRNPRLVWEWYEYRRRTAEARSLVHPTMRSSISNSSILHLHSSPKRSTAYTGAPVRVTLSS